MENNEEVPPEEDAAGPVPPDTPATAPDPTPLTTPVKPMLAITNGDVRPSDVARIRRVIDNAQAVLLDSITAFDRLINMAHAARAVVIADAHRWTTSTAQSGRPNGSHDLTEFQWSDATAAHEGFIAELAALLKLPEGSARNLLTESELLQYNLPRTHRALLDGDISYRHAQVIIDNALALPDSAMDTYETEVLTDAETLTVPQLKKKAITLRELSHPETSRARHTTAVKDRCFGVHPARDGMAYLEMTLTNDDASAINDRVEAMARSLRVTGEERTLPQLRCDVAVDLLLKGVTETGLGAGVVGNVYVTIPILTLMGKGDEPAMLEGFGPIDPETARRLAGTATGFHRILIHPETGAMLSFGRDTYRVPKALRRYLEVRDETCRFVGCNRSARHCDMDHTTAWQYGGETTFSNLAALCGRSHKLKHETGWDVSQNDQGTLTWTSPAGKHYATHPASRIRPPLLPPDLTPPPVKKPRIDHWAQPLTYATDTPF
ncbi:HNH endonuclease signature motif containing protein [Cryobacterium psychrophilum]|uniref:HNH endonuclease signature motif containing protein n=1 Tax=Cryobacterium psychrophilum TaxID=41988 RepID=UPI001065C49F|nr:HNH endonuclease signature motif containing protein [Cryobacterium psychrophilum]TDW31361.1 uncharacterized protein DUF222 [Cryobacterium psychrophilum]